VVTHFVFSLHSPANKNGAAIPCVGIRAAEHADWMG
jgi:hypothetical protein